MEFLGNPLDYLQAFLAGVAVSFTPCIYPLLPITAGYIGVNSRGSKLKGLSLSLVYVSGVALTYSILGVLAALTGIFFGRVSSHPFTYIIVGMVFIVFGLSMFDLFILALPQFIRPPAIKKKGYPAAFILGISSGLVVSPCLTPVLGAILVYLATKRNIIYASTLLFSFAYGMGALLILIGTFSSLAVNLPKAGRWLVFIKRLGALVLIGAGLYFIYAGIGALIR
jgi:thiol:disulfide interchange protein DsbD